MNKKIICLLFFILFLSTFASDENKIIIRNILRTKEYLEMEHRKIVESEEELYTEVPVNDEMYHLCKQLKMDEIKILPETVVSYCSEENEIKKGICWHKGDFVFDYKRLEKLNGIYLEQTYYSGSEDDFTLHKFKNGKLYSRIHDARYFTVKDPTGLIVENYFIIDFDKKEYLIKTEEKLEMLQYYLDFSFDENDVDDYMAKTRKINITINIDQFPEEITDENIDGISKKEKYCKEIVELLIEDYMDIDEYNSNFDFEIPIIEFSFKFKDDRGKKDGVIFFYTYTKPINSNIGSFLEEIK